MTIVRTFEEARHRASGRVGLVPTMGFLHEGHLSLIGEARRHSDTVVVSVFVNPLQFGEASDLESYPRDLERDMDLASEAGADVVFAPAVETMYPGELRTRVLVADVADGMEGEYRPGHFAGVATVVAKLFAGIRPDLAFFGRKDAQQLAVVTTMATDLSFPVEIVGVPIVRERDGLALSSRNVRLDATHRTQALALSTGLFAAADRFDDGSRSSSTLISVAEKTMEAEGVQPEYVAVARASDASSVDEVTAPSFLAVAARVGDVRLIDNVWLDPAGGSADRGLRLETSSILYGEG